MRQKTNEAMLAHARAMRSAPTPFEQKLWHALRAKRFNGVKFGRQVVIGPYIVDFVPRSRKLVIEVDGDTHDSDNARGERRTAWLNEQGYQVIRLTNRDVAGNLEGVLTAIELARAARPLSQPSPQGGEGLSR